MGERCLLHGVRISEGDKVEGAWKSIFLTWKEVDKRTRELIELGQYIPKHEAERADAAYEDMVANMIAFLYRDALLKSENSLDEVYDAWMESESSHMDEIREVLDSAAESLIRDAQHQREAKAKDGER